MGRHCFGGRVNSDGMVYRAANLSSVLEWQERRYN